MSTPRPTPSEKHIWMAASIQTCRSRDRVSAPHKERYLRGDRGGERPPRGDIPEGRQSGVSGPRGERQRG